MRDGDAPSQCPYGSLVEAVGPGSSGGLWAIWVKPCLVGFPTLRVGVLQDAGLLAAVPAGAV